MSISHFLLARVNLQIEQAFLFEEEHIGDAMNNILSGDVLCVTWYHQIQRLLWWMTNTKRRTILWAIKLYTLEKRSILTTTQPPQSDIYEYDNVNVDTGYDTDGCIMDDTDTSRAVEVDIISDEENENSRATPQESVQELRDEDGIDVALDFSNKSSSVEFKKDKH